MIEQEKREKAIEEMGEIADSVYKKHLKETGEDSIEIREIYGAFYDAGYRKEEEVRKEVFEKIYQRLKEIKVVGNNCNGYLIIGAIQDLEEEFGVEVEE